MTNEISFKNIKLINPKELGITFAASEFVYNLVSYNNKVIENKINKAAIDLCLSGNLDLGNYLYLTQKVSFKDNNINKFAAEIKAQNINQDNIRDAFEHANAVFETDYKPEDFEYDLVDMPITKLYNYDDVDSWKEWDAGELLELSEDELEKEVSGFRENAIDLIKNENIPPILIIDDGKSTVVGDGRGRISIAIGMNWDKIPAIIAKKKIINESNLQESFVKLAGTIDLGDPDLAGKSLADIVLFLLRRIPAKGRTKAVSSMISKIRDISPAETASKKMGDYSSMGQSLTFIKNVLAGHDEGYVRRVLDSIVRNLA
jgi:hypothetical protein